MAEIGEVRQRKLYRSVDQCFLELRGLGKRRLCWMSEVAPGVEGRKDRWTRKGQLTLAEEWMSLNRRKGQATHTLRYLKANKCR